MIYIAIIIYIAFQKPFCSMYNNLCDNCSFKNPNHTLISQLATYLHPTNWCLSFSLTCKVRSLLFVADSFMGAASMSYFLISYSICISSKCIRVWNFFTYESTLTGFSKMDLKFYNKRLQSQKSKYLLIGNWLPKDMIWLKQFQVNRDQASAMSIYVDALNHECLKIIVRSDVFQKWHMQSGSGCLNI